MILTTHTYITNYYKILLSINDRNGNRECQLSEQPLKTRGCPLYSVDDFFLCLMAKLALGKKKITSNYLF